MILLGALADGRALRYDATLYEFRVDRTVVTYRDVVALDQAGHVQWQAAEQRDWLYRINPADLDRCNREALGRHGNGYEGLSPEEQVQRDARRDDSVLAGKIVEADPALVRAVADALEQEGLLRAGAPEEPAVVLPEGMEALAQVQKQPGRSMTVMERYLMHRILKHDDRQKARREKAEEVHGEAQAEEAEEAARPQDGRTATAPRVEKPQEVAHQDQDRRVGAGRWLRACGLTKGPKDSKGSKGASTEVPGMAEAQRRSRKKAAESAKRA